jgi:LPS-assembly protein
MMGRRAPGHLDLLLIVPLVVAATAADPTQAQAQNRPLNETTVSATRLFDRGKNYWFFTGAVEMESGDAKIYAEEIEAWVNDDLVEARGNVQFTQGNNRVSADRAVFNTKTRLGTFYNAYGIASIQPGRQAVPAGGVAAPPMTGQDTEVIFFGDEVEKIGPKKYRIKNGGFTTCLQPTPRWDLSADTIVLNIDHYTLLRQAILKVKGVPMLYLPVLYYPTKEEQRATGFLLPNYSATTIRGQSIQVPFFWAINRSHDATLAYEWFSKAGRGVDTQYRYNLGLGSDGSLRTHVLDQGQAVVTQPDGSVRELPATRSFEVRGAANQRLGTNIRARGRVDYFSSVESMQQLNTNIYDASRSQRSFGGNIVGAWRTYSLNATIDRNENFYNTTDSVVNGGTPRLAVSRNERPLFGGTYFSASSEFIHMIRQSNTPALTIDSGLSRLDFTPQIRFPFKRFQWFTVNSSVGWRETFYSRSYHPVGSLTYPGTNQRLIIDDPVNRQYFTMSAQAVGPIFNRIWDTPNNRYAERFKHSIEPFFNVSRTSSIETFDRIVQSDGVDGILGNTTNVTYGVNNRFFAKRRVGGTLSQSQEIVNISLSQTYYTDARQAFYDRQYATSTGGPPSHFSPLVLGARITPTRDLQARVNAEFDSRHQELRTLSADGSYNWTSRLQSTVGWSQKYYVDGLGSWNDYLDHYINASVNARTRDNRYGGLYSFNYNILRSSLLQQRLTAFYNAQCCGIAFDYQRYNFNYSPTLGVDRRFFLSFTLAGLGNFSPFSGAMAGVPR